MYWYEEQMSESPFMYHEPKTLDVYIISSDDYLYSYSINSKNDYSAKLVNESKVKNYKKAENYTDIGEYEITFDDDTKEIIYGEITY